MKAANIMTRPVVSVHTSTPMRQAIVLLTENHVGALPVVDDDGRVVAVVGESDLLRDHVSDGTSERTWESSTAVREIMHQPVRFARVDTEVNELARMMLSFGLHSLPIVDDEEALVGIVARRDLLRTLVRDDDIIASEVQRLLDDYTGRPGRWTTLSENGRVTLTGDMDNEAERRIAEALARTIAGVREVAITATR